MRAFRCIVMSVSLLVTGAMASGEAVTIHVLGITQDGGYPQTGCYRLHCAPAREDATLQRSVSSIAIVDEAAGEKYLFDATPDINAQLYRLNLVAPDADFLLAGIFLTHAHIGHYTGLMHFGHEAMGASDVPVFVMPRMGGFLKANGPWDQLVRYRNIVLETLRADSPVTIGNDIRVTPFLVPHRDEYSETVGYRIDGPNKSAVFIPDIDKWSKWNRDIREIVRSVDYALLDATFYADGELPDRAMGEVPHPFVSESMALLEDLSEEEKARVIFIHMNHTNALLINGSGERRTVEARGFKIAYEGMRLEL